MNNTVRNDRSLMEQDLGPLAWVLGEMRQSYRQAVGILQTFVSHAESESRPVEALADEAAQLQQARQHIHQACGALEMVGAFIPAFVLRQAETAVAHLAQHPAQCDSQAVQVLTQAGIAVGEYLENLLHDASISPVLLFPAYRDVHALTGSAQPVSPADLWHLEGELSEPQLTMPVKAIEPSDRVRLALDQAILRTVQGAGSVRAEKDLIKLCLGLAAGTADFRERTFWKVAAGFFEGLALELIPNDVYVKRAATRVLVQYASLIQGDAMVTARWMQDLLFFCAQARPPRAVAAPVLRAVRAAFGLEAFEPLDYEHNPFSLIDPFEKERLLDQLKTVADGWAKITEGDEARLQPMAQQFAALGQALLAQVPETAQLVEELNAVVGALAQHQTLPSAELAMEVATTVLYLQAMLGDMHVRAAHSPERMQELSQRLRKVAETGQAEPIAAWMEDLYSRASDAAAMGNVVGELRLSLSEAENSIDQFFRNPANAEQLKNVPGMLGRIKGVLSVLGLDAAIRALQQIGHDIEAFLDHHAQEGAEPLSADDPRFERIGSNLGALGLQVDMLAYQPALAKELFVYDADKALLKPLMGRLKAYQIGGRDIFDAVQEAPATEAAALPQASSSGADAATPAAVPSAPAAPAPVPAEAPATELAQFETVAAPLAAPVAATAAADDEDDGDLLDIFLEEAQSVIDSGREAIEQLEAAPGDMAQQTTLRRAFHTLKGSSRMVGLDVFGEAAWAMEQLLNAWLAEQKPFDANILALCGKALIAMDGWVTDIHLRDHAHWSAKAFQRSADAMRLQGRYIPLEPADLSDEAPAQLPVPQEAAQDTTVSSQDVPATDFDDATVLDSFLHELDNQISESPENAERWNIPFKATELQSGLGRLPEGGGAEQAATPPAVAFGDDAQLQADLDALGDLPPLVPPPSEPALLTEVVEDGGEAEEAAPQQAADAPEEQGAVEEVTAEVVEPGDADAPPASETLEEGAVAAESSEDDSVVDVAVIDTAAEAALVAQAPEREQHLLQALQLSQDIEAELLRWSFSGDPVLPAGLAQPAQELVETATLLDVDAGFARFVQHFQSVLLRLLDMPLTEAHPDLDILQDSMQEVQSVLDGIVAGTGNGRVAQTMQERLQALEEALVRLARPQPPAPLPSRDLVAAGRAAFYDLPPEAAEAPDAIGESRLAVPFDEVDLDLFPIFEEEAADLLPRLIGALRQWSQQPDSFEARSEALRVLHTLKGSSRLAGARQMGELAHQFESEIEAIEAKPGNGAQVHATLKRYDDLQSLFDALSARVNQTLDQPAEPAFESSTLADAATGGLGDAVSDSVAAAVAAAVPADGEHAVPDGSDAMQTEQLGAEYRGELPGPTALVVQTARESRQTVRVRSQLINRLINQAGEIQISRSRAESRLKQLNASLDDMTVNLERLRQQLRELEVQAESQMQSRMSLGKEHSDFDPLEFDRYTRVQELTRMMAETVNDVATVQRTLQAAMIGTEDDLVAQERKGRELQRDLLRTRMVEFDSVSERLHALVRQAAEELGKQVELDIENGSIEMDRLLLDRMMGGFEHLLRNCVGHGIELPKERKRLRKPEVGHITISVAQEGNDVAVTFRDDGAGLDLEAIRHKGIERGLLQPEQTLSDEDLANLIFLPGFSTASKLTGLAGRGIGMDVVRTEINALGGRIETSTKTGEGSAFRLVMPLTTAVTQVLLVRVGALSFGIPANLVSNILHLDAGAVGECYAQRTLEVDGVDAPFYWSGALLQHSSRPQPNDEKNTPVVIVRSASQVVALHVDEVLGNQEVVVKNLGPQLSHLPGLAGMSVLASGAVLLVYNFIALANVYGAQAYALQDLGQSREADGAAGATGEGAEAQPALLQPLAFSAASAAHLPLVLVVDDSITVRRVTQRLLKREGYRVALAADGLQAIERLKEETPAVVLSDIEMPQMDGFELLRYIRSEASLAHLPVVMITSRTAQKHRDHADELGANHYLGKPYSDAELLALVRQYTEQTSTAQA
ncbi:hybrid sensor histidine kinase/response regulator [Corticibacter populi]|uniref:Chemotaxis protein CheA n=1 Tax=Corticibacter populi TaxID=1550736 RepID=A0A3M6QIM2_9BURK|nr:response regulator [Corticibacter populi]RMX02946.1 hybrid sensor histidine kinase/response regulator [Corticibacter populi]RZS33361.1 chemosensory pili system protein ChpA (sensor histidine kinase/response regulator) [Corticibacter populi]